MGKQQPRRYEGRLLPRPGDELVDQGLGFDLGTALDRRQLLQIFGVGAAGLGLAACVAEANPATTGSGANGGNGGNGSEIPDETAGPYPGDGSNGPDALEQSG